MNKNALSIFRFTKNQQTGSPHIKFPLLWKIHSLITTVILLAVGVITWVTIVEQIDNDRQHLLAKDSLILEQLAAAVNSGFYTLNWIFVEDSIHKNAANEEINYIHLIRPDRTLYLSSDDSIQIPRLISGTGLTWENKQEFFLTRSVPIGKESWQLILQGTTASLQKHGYTILSNNLALGLIIILLSSVFTFHFSKKLTNSLSSLSDVAKKIGQKRYDARVTEHSCDEIGLLAEHINSMAELLQAQQHQEGLAKKELQQTNNRLTSILHSTTQGFFRTDTNDIIQEINPKTSEILGRSQEELLGLSILDLLNTTNKNILRKQLLLRKKGLSSSYEIEFLHPEGHLIPCFCNANPLYNSEGQRSGSFAMVTDITTLKETQHFLQQAKERAEDASHMKSSFLATMSHEIRTPLNGIIGALELLNDQKPEPARQRKLIHTVQKSADYLLVLLNDILDLSKIESGKFILEEQPVIPTQLRDQLQSMFITQSREKDIHLELVVEKSLPEILIGDERLLQQVCMNLLSNAIKFTSLGGTVSMRLSGEKNKEGLPILKGRVRDTGIGIAAENQTVIFDTFSQADSSTTRNFGGSGLGLALCKKLCVLMGGDIWLQSVENEGSSFFFSVQLQEATQKQRDEAMKSLHVKAVCNKNVAPLRILLVDDNDVNRDVAKMLLENAKHSVTTAPDGLEALQLLTQDDFDCILMDIQMPRMDGVTAVTLIRTCEQDILPPQDKHHELLKRLQNKLRNSHTAVIALTANVFSHDKHKYLEAGMDAFLGKPVRPDEIRRVLAEVSQESDTPKALTTPPQAEREIPAAKNLTEIKKYLQTHYQFSSEQIGTLLKVSMNSIQNGLDDMEKTCKTGNLKDLSECGHKFKGTLANLGLSQLTDMAQSIQLTCQKGEKINYGEVVAAMRRNLKPLLEEYSHSIEMS